MRCKSQKRIQMLPAAIANGFGEGLHRGVLTDGVKLRVLRAVRELLIIGALDKEGLDRGTLC